MLDLIPAPYRVLLELAAVAALLGGMFLAGHVGGEKVGYARGHAEAIAVQARWNAELAAESAAAASAAMANQAETARRITAQQEASNEAQRLEARSRAADVTRAAADASLQQRVAAVAARCSPAASDSAAASVSPAASSPGDLLAYVQRRMGEAAATVVRFADDSSIAGAECSGRYDALRP